MRTHRPEPGSVRPCVLWGPETLCERRSRAQEALGQPVQSFKWSSCSRLFSPHRQLAWDPCPHCKALDLHSLTQSSQKLWGVGAVYSLHLEINRGSKVNSLPKVTLLWQRCYLNPGQNPNSSCWIWIIRVRRSESKERIVKLTTFNKSFTITKFYLEIA